MAAPLAAPADVGDLWPEYTTDLMDRVERLIDKASGLVRRAVLGIDDRIALFATDPTSSKALDPEVVATVVATIVARFLNNPTGALNRTQSAGTFTETIGYGERIGGAYAQRGTLVVTEADREQLLENPDLVPASSIRVRAGYPQTYPTSYPRHH